VIPVCGEKRGQELPATERLCSYVVSDHPQALVTTRLLIPHRFGRVGGRRAIRLHADDGGRDEESGEGRGQEHRDRQVDPVGEILKPGAHGDIADRPSDKVGRDDPLQELTGEQDDDP
jgi:hypothetical protein